VNTAEGPHGEPAYQVHYRSAGGLGRRPLRPRSPHGSIREHPPQGASDRRTRASRGDLKGGGFREGLLPSVSVAGAVRRTLRQRPFYATDRDVAERVFDAAASLHPASEGAPFESRARDRGYAWPTRAPVAGVTYPRSCGRDSEPVFPAKAGDAGGRRAHKKGPPAGATPGQDSALAFSRGRIRPQFHDTISVASSMIRTAAPRL